MAFLKSKAPFKKSNSGKFKKSKLEQNNQKRYLFLCDSSNTVGKRLLGLFSFVDRRALEILTRQQSDATGLVDPHVLPCQQQNTADRKSKQNTRSKDLDLKCLCHCFGNMASIFKRHGTAVSAAVFAFIALGMIVTALLSNYWVMADLERKVGNKTQEGGSKHFGMFNGVSKQNFGFGARERKFTGTIFLSLPVNFVGGTC